MRQQPVLAGVLLGSVLCFVALVLTAWWLDQGNARLASTLRRETLQWNALAGAPIAPTAANEAAARAHLQALRAQSGRLRDGLRAQGSWQAVPVFRGPEELYFDLIGLIERQQQACREAGIATDSGELFGYGQVVRAQQVTFVTNEPEAVRATMERLHRQRQTLDAVLAALVAARPERLVGVERAPVQALAPEVVARGEDFFEVDPSVTAAVTGAIETYGVRLRFAGKTAVLRAFLENVRAGQRPIVVRSVEVRPVSEGSAPSAQGRATGQRRAPAASDSPFAVFGGARPTAAAEAESGAVPIVEDNDSVFTVVLEGYALLEPTATGEEAR